MKHLLRSARLEGEVVDLLVDASTIVEIGASGSLGAQGATELGLQDAMVFPGFIDMQINGSFGHDFISDPKSVWDVGAQLPRYGVCSFMPTAVTARDDQVEAVLHEASSTPPEGYTGAKILGLHAEGPFLAESRKGAHDGSLVQSLDARPSWIESPFLKMMTLAPEKEFSQELITFLVARGVLVSAGHTEATADETAEGINQGIRYGTHLYSAMSGLHHRTPGAAAELLVDDRVTCGVIADGIHMHDTMLNLAWKMKGKDRINLVSDAAAAAGMPEGQYQLSGFDVFVKDGAVRLADGTLAGSSLTLDVAIRYLKQATKCTWQEAVHTVTAVPARLLGLPVPRIEVGATATLTCLNDDGFVLFTMIDGEVAFSQLS